MTSPQDPWQQYQQQQYQQGGQQVPYGTPSGGFAQQNVPGYPQQQAYPQQGYPQQQPGFQQPGYQAYPGGQPPNPYGAPQVSPQAGMIPKPATVNAAFWIAIAVPALTVVLYVLNFVFAYSYQQEAMASMQEQLEKSGLGDSSQFTQSVSIGALVGGFVLWLILYLVLTGLWVLFGFKMRAGRNWARITLTVFAAIWILFAIVGLIMGGITTASFSSAELPAGYETPAPPVAMMALSYIQNALALIAMIAFIVLVFLKQSNWYFKAAQYR